LLQIESRAFDSSGVHSIVIPRSVERLCSCSFANCESLSSISFEIQSRLLQIESHAFYRSSFQSITIPRHVAFIGSYAFSNSSATSIVLPRTITDIDSLAFRYSKVQPVLKEEGDPILLMENSLLINNVRHALIRDFSSSVSVTIDRNIEILGSYCFADCTSLLSVQFQPGSKLIRIESYAFCSSSLDSILIPRSVEIICLFAFLDCKALCSVKFEADAQLARLESQIFSGSSLRVIVLPRNVQFLDGSVFVYSALNSVQIDENNPTFVIDGSFLVDRVHHMPIRYFSLAATVVMDDNIEIIGSYCFAECQSPTSISFSIDSQLICIKSHAFSHSSIRSIVIPASLETISSSCFFRCSSLVSVTFQPNSRLIRIGPNAFSYSALRSFIVPRNVSILSRDCFRECRSLTSFSFEIDSQLHEIHSSALNHGDSLERSISLISSIISFIAADAFSSGTQLSINDPDSDPDLHYWCLSRHFHPRKDFRRRLRLGLELPALSDLLINLSDFEGGPMLYRRRSDGLKIVAKDIATQEGSSEIETLLNLRHPCIATPFGFVLSANGTIMTIISRYAGIGSLAAVLSDRPSWWTATAKAITVAGLLFGLRFLHSFGRLHGRLKPTNILFDDDHGIQITDFASDDCRDNCTGFTAPEVVAGYEVTAEADIFSLGMLFLAIITGCASWPPGKTRILPPFIRESVSNVISLALSRDPSQRPSLTQMLEQLRFCEFALIDGADSVAVLEFVGRIESGGLD
jgi:hypothetical protein